ncbi:flagellar motor protein MotD [Chitinibacteraceae bacterium HSL-7]
MARKRRHEEHDNHERWLVSYADFITLLFAFFVVMYAISSVNEGKYKVLSDSLIDAFRHPLAQTDIVRIQADPKSALVIKAQPTPNPPRENPDLAEKTRKMRGMAGDLRAQLGPMIQDGRVRVTQSRRGIAVEIADSVLFQVAKADLNDQARTMLSAVARLIADTDNLIVVEGHTDNQPMYSAQFPSNWELSAARAAAVVRLFAENGVVPKRMVALGYGEYRPVDGNDTPEGRARNRRVTLNILADNKDEVVDLSLSPDAAKQ